MDQRKIIFNSISTKLTEQFPGIYVSQRYELVPEEIPCAFIEQISKIRTRRNATLANDDNQYVLTFEVQVFGRTLAEGYEIMNCIEDAFKDLAFFEDMCTPIDNADITVFRMVARFSAQIGDKVYEMSTL